MKNKHVKRVISSLLCTVLVATSLSGMAVVAESSEYTGWSSRANVDVTLRMGVIADSQFAVTDTGTDKLNEALKAFSQIDAEYDGLAMVGDIIYQPTSAKDKTAATKEEAKTAYLREEPYNMLNTSLNTYAAGKEYFYAVGNHEFPLNTTNSVIAEAALDLYEEKMSGQTRLMDKTFNGYHFITAAPKDYSNALTAGSETWLKEKIDAAIAEEGGVDKPVFVLLHEPIQNTTYGSRTDTICYSAEFKEYLQTKPQVVVLTGHTHYATRDPETIWQDGFTVVSCGCTGGSMSGRDATYSEGNETMLLEVDANNVVSIYRMDINSGEYIGNPWVLDIPAMVEDTKDGTVDTDVWNYTDARTGEAKNPMFPKDARLTVTELNSDGFGLSFPKGENEAVNEDGFVIAYRIQVINQKTQQQVQDYQISTDYYKYEQAETISTTIEKLAGNTKYTVNVYGISPFGTQSEPLTRTVRTKVAETSGVVENAKETITYNMGDVDEHNLTDRMFADAYWGFKEAGLYVTFKVDVPSAGKYQLYNIARTVGSNGTFDVKVNGKTHCNITVPKSDSTAKNEIDAGYYYLEEGEHTITFTASQESDNQVTMYGMKLVKEEDAFAITINAHEAVAFNSGKGHYNEYDHMGLWGSGDATFQVNVPLAGEYDVYVDAGNAVDGNKWSVTIGGQTVTSGEYLSLGGYNIYSREKLGSVTLSEGVQQLKAALNWTRGSATLRRIVLIQKGVKSHQITKYAIDCTSLYAVNSADKRASSMIGQHAMFYKGRIAFTVTPELTGVYNLSWWFVSSGNTCITYVNGEQVDSRAYTGTPTYPGNMDQHGGVEESICDIPLVAGQTYEIVFEDMVGKNAAGEGAAVSIEKLVLTHVRDLNADEYPDEIYVDANDYDRANKERDFSESSNGLVLGTVGNYGEYDVEVPAGNYVLSINYGRSSGDGELQLVVNGETAGTMNLPLAGGYLKDYVEKEIGVISLNGGLNSIRIQNGGAWFTYGSIKLEKIHNPVSELYQGNYIVMGAGLANEFSGHTDGDFIFRTYLPANMKEQYVQVVGGIYDGDTLVKSVWSEPVIATENSVVTARLSNVELDESKKYTWKVSDYVRYTSKDAGITDGSETISGKLLNTVGAEISGTSYDKTTYGMKLIFENANATMDYASGLQLSLIDSGSLQVTVGSQEMEIAPAQFGFSTFKGQVFELQITTDVIGGEASIGIWINGTLANSEYYSIANPEALSSAVSFAQGIIRYYLWNLAKPDESIDYIQLLGDEPYLVEFDSLIHIDTNTTYISGDKVATVGNYKAITCSVENPVVIWKMYDLHADGTCDVRDLVAMKKVESDAQILPETNAGWMAASQLDSAYELETMRQNLIATGN